MTNAWSLLYDQLNMTEHSTHYYDYTRNDPNRENPFVPEESVKIDGYSVDGKSNEDFWGEGTITFNLDMKTNNPNRFKYSEERILKELTDYISSTYNQHYSSGDDKVQTLDLIEACGDGEAFCRSNILKYASRYDKKGTARRDIMKILHYAVLLMHFNDKNAKRETYNQ